MIRESAPGKVILFGEHAVVYGRPAIAVPVPDVRATASIEPGSAGSGLMFEAPDLGVSYSLAEKAQHGLAQMAALVLDWLGADEPDAIIRVRSGIPIAGGLGSGAAVSAAVGRALCTYSGRSISATDLSTLVYEVEKTYHGTPSGIDNTVVCFEQPVYFVKGHAPDLFRIKRPFRLLIGDTGVPSPTHKTVGQVRAAWEQNPESYSTIFDEIGYVSQQARQAIEDGSVEALGPLMNENQRWLERIGVSSPELEKLITAAGEAGAAGGKLSGGGGGGNMIALISATQQEYVKNALLQAGAVRVLSTEIR